MSSDATITDDIPAGDTSASDTLAEVDTHHDDHTEGHSRHREPTDGQYVVIALILAALTALEIAATETGVIEGSFLIVSLVLLMVVKFAFVVLFFMHLRFDSRLFSMIFYIGLALAVVLYIVVLATFHFFQP
jgi:cytochrome c oxidase subunit 4